MEIIVSTAIGGEITDGVDGEMIIHALIIRMRKSLKKYFEEIFFESLGKIRTELPQPGIPVRKKNIRRSCASINIIGLPNLFLR